jgi:hypothetical protein
MFKTSTSSFKSVNRNVLVDQFNIGPKKAITFEEKRWPDGQRS